MKERNVGQCRCALFDIDGTLLEGFLIQSFPRFLADERLIDATYSDRIDRIASDYRSGKVTYRYAAETVPNLYALALKGKERDNVKAWAREFIKSYLPKHLLPYSIQLVRRTRSFVDITIAVSGSPIEVIEELGELGFDKTCGSLFEIEANVYTGRVVENLILGEEKAKLVRKFSEGLNISLSKSVAFGDTDQDEPFLSMVGLPVAINPNEELKNMCDLRGWKYLHMEKLKDWNELGDWLRTKLQ